MPGGMNAGAQPVSDMRGKWIPVSVGFVLFGLAVGTVVWRGRRHPVLIFFVEYTYGVDDGAGLLGQFHDLGQSAGARVVTAIADDDQHFLIPATCLQFL